MTNISAKAIVRCPLSQADRQLSLFFKSCGNTDGTIARLELRADLAITGGAPLVFERPAIATITARREPSEMLPHYAVSWAPENGGPYPTFTGNLRIGTMDDYESFELLLDGRYEPPLGVLGAGFDLVIGHRIADSMAAHLLQTITKRIEETFIAEEHAKRAGTAG